MHRRFEYLRPATLLTLLALSLCTNCGDDPAARPEDDGALDAGVDASLDAPVAPDAADAGGDATTDADAISDEDADAGDSLRCPPVMKAIPAGSFDRANAAVSVGPFCLDRTEVTLGAFQACVTAGACDPIPTTVDERCNARSAGRDGHPVDCVTAAQAASFCAWKGKRLPSSDELSWAARGAVADAKYPWGTTDPAPSDSPPRLCWAPVSPDHTCTAGSFPEGASPQGVLDLAGNVWEWTATDEGAGNRRVQGGGYWDQNPVMLFQADYWEPMPADTAAPAYGFRCAM